ncbi:MAG: hypothetical protein RL653_504 [Pseudomonadota bacterium]|jgi:hypothetical protein
MERAGERREEGTGPAGSAEAEAVPTPDALTAEFRDAASRAWSDTAAADRLNALLDGLQPVLGAAGAAELIHELLGQRGVAMAEDSRGRTCRGHAVETLLGLGHPWALTVSPEDLQWYRKEGRPLGIMGKLAVGASLLAAGNQSWAFLQELWRVGSAWAPGRELPVDALAGLATGLAAAVFAVLALLRPARKRKGRVAQTGLLMAGVGCGVAAAFGSGMGTAWLTALVTVAVSTGVLFAESAVDG